MFQVGTSIVIKGTDNVQSRFPHLIGQRGVIVSCPSHPCTWFSVQIADSNMTVKLQPTAMQLVTSTDIIAVTAPSKSAVVSTSNVTSDPPVSSQDSMLESVSECPDLDNLVSRPRSQSHDYTPQCSHVNALKKGASVTILRTENVSQRAPHLVGQKGIVKEVPGM
jgi:hypothetical protein